MNWRALPLILSACFLKNLIDLGEFSTRFTREELLRAAAKYGKAISHTVRLYRHLIKAMNGRPFELEMSVDETESATTLVEHVYIASELKRLGVQLGEPCPSIRRHLRERSGLHR